MAEITRQMYVLFYINELREQYALSTDNIAKESLKTVLTNAGLLTAPLFGLFIFSFGIGNLCLGLSLSGEKGFSRLLSVLLILWSLGSFTALGNSFWENGTVSKVIEKYNFSFQPLMRILLGIWLWQKSSLLKPALHG